MREINGGLRHQPTKEGSDVRRMSIFRLFILLFAVQVLLQACGGNDHEQDVEQAVKMDATPFTENIEEPSDHSSSESAVQGEAALTPPEEYTNVMIITLDTTRWDRLGCYGDGGARTTALDRLAERGVLFRSAYCHVPLTLPSHTCLFTGVYPPTTGVRVNGEVVSDEGVTMAEVFKSHGYRTGAFIGAWVLKWAFGLHRGFDFYEDDIRGDDEKSIYSERSADQVCDSAIKWLNRAPFQPFFVWIHFFDPHYPYAPPETYEKMFDHAYDGEISFMDRQLERIIIWLEERGLREKTLIAVAGDHGEAFNEHDEVEHGLLVYDTTMRVPLMFSCPGRLPNAGIRTDHAELVDVMPTVIDLMGWASAPGLHGRALFGDAPRREVNSVNVYGESEYPEFAYRWAGLKTVIKGPWKYIDAPEPELYNHEIDPAEMNNAAADHPELTADFKAQLIDLLGDMEKRKEQEMELDQQTLSALESLGYVAASAPVNAKFEDENLRNPMKMISVYNAIVEARHILKRNRHEKVVSLLEPMSELSPETDELFAVLGEAYYKLEKYQRAEDAFRKSLRINSTNPRRLVMLGDALYHQNKIDEARSVFLDAKKIASDYDETSSRLGMMYLMEGRYEESLKHFKKYMRLNPDNARSIANTAGVLSRMKRYKEAIKLMEKALRIEPDFGAAHRSLWQLYRATGQYDKSIRALREAEETLPYDCDIKINLASALASMNAVSRNESAGKLKEAKDLAEKCCNRNPKNAFYHSVLSFTYAVSGSLDRAVKTAQKGLSLAEEQGNQQMVRRIRDQLAKYQKGAGGY